jgi:hypothetical protein
MLPSQLLKCINVWPVRVAGDADKLRAVET